MDSKIVVPGSPSSEDQKRYELLMHLSEIREKMYNQIDLASQFQSFFEEDLSTDQKKELENVLANKVKKMKSDLWMLDGSLVKTLHIIRSGASFQDNKATVPTTTGVVSAKPLNAAGSSEMRESSSKPCDNRSATTTLQFIESTMSTGVKHLEKEMSDSVDSKMVEKNKNDDYVAELWKEIEKLKGVISEKNTIISKQKRMLNTSVTLQRSSFLETTDKEFDMVEKKSSAMMGSGLYPTMEGNTGKIVTDHLRMPNLTDVLRSNQFFVEMWYKAPEPIDESKIDQFIMIHDIPPQLVEQIDYDFVYMKGELSLRMLGMDDRGQRALSALAELTKKKEMEVIQIHQLDATGQNEIGVVELKRVTFDSIRTGFSHNNGNVNRVFVQFSFQDFEIQGK